MDCPCPLCWLLHLGVVPNILAHLQVHHLLALATTRSFIKEDFEKFLKGETPVADITTHLLPTVTSVHIQWRTQKNKQYHEKISFFCDAINHRLCPVAAAICIVQQARSLHADMGLPLGIRSIHDNPAQFKYITASNTTIFLQKVAQSAHNLPRKYPNIAALSTHSIHVMATNLFHGAKFSNSFIQNRLQWRSNTFLMYLRNTSYSTRSHATTLALDLCSLPPPTGASACPHEPHKTISPTTL